MTYLVTSLHMRLKLPKFHKKEKTLARKIPVASSSGKKHTQGSYGEIVKSRQRKTRNIKINFLQKNYLKSKYIKVVLVLLTIVAVGFLIIPIISSSDFYKVESITIVGNSRVAKEDISLVLSKYQDKSMLSFSNDDVKKAVITNIDFIKDVYVRKSLPGSLEVEVVEEFPELVLINLEGAYLIDKESRVVSIASASKLDLSQAEIELIEGEDTFESDYIKERYLAGIKDQEERKKVDWAKVKIEDKKTIYNQVIMEISSKLDKLINESNEYTKSKLATTLPIIVEYNANLYAIGQSIHSVNNDLTFTRSLLEAFKEIKIEVSKVVWTSKVIVEVHTKDGKKVIFIKSDERTLEDQIRDLKALSFNNRLNSGSVFDLRVTTISVK